MTESEEENAVRQIGDLIGYGRTMHLCEKLWRNKLGKQKGGEHSVGPCVGLLMPCEHTGYKSQVECDWCCGSGRVTKKTAEVMCR